MWSHTFIVSLERLSPPRGMGHFLALPDSGISHVEQANDHDFPRYDSDFSYYASYSDPSY